MLLQRHGRTVLKQQPNERAMTEGSWEPKPLEVDYDSQPIADSRLSQEDVEAVQRNWKNTVYVLDALGDRLVVIPLAWARRLASLRAAIRECGTWGEFLDEIAADPKTLADLTHRLGGELPNDDESFSADDLPGYGDGDWPMWPAQAMLDWLPESVQALGTVEYSTFNGPFLQLDPDGQKEVIEALAAEGIECHQDTENIVARASGW
jgi:hypothetical protein